MQGIGPGTVLGSRYALRRRLSHGPDLERWFALDITLERDVTLTIVSTEHPNCAGVLDAARRAAGVEDARLVRILDVGTEADSSFIVEEARGGSESLATILLQGPLPAEEARRVAGETARGLETAGQRGLHHLRLTPHHVLMAPDGAIRVSGVAVAAALDGPDEQEPDAGTALRRDALGLVAVVYAALTSRWPLDGEVPGVEPAPRVGHGAIAPSEIVAGIPADLDALCRATLNEADGPLTPADFADQISPWPSERVQRAGVDPTLVLRLPASDTPITRSTGDTGDRGDLSDRSDTARAAAPVILPPAGSPALPVIGDAPEPTIAVSSPSGAPPAGPGEEPPTSRLGTAGAGAVAGAGSGRLSTLAKPAAGKGPLTEASRGNERMRLPVGLTPADDIGPPLPLLPASTGLPPSRGQSKVVMLVMAAFVAAALVVGYRGLVGTGTDGGQGRPTPRRTVIVSAPAVTVPASPAPQAATTAGGPIAILSATGFDPQGDQGESNAQAARVFDGDPATTWSTELYNTAQFGSLKKGVGLLLDLGQPTSVHDVTIDLANGPLDVTVYVATSPSLAGATSVLGNASAATGRIQLKAAATMPESQFVIVWFSSLAPVHGKFGASISEIALN